MQSIFLEISFFFLTICSIFSAQNLFNFIAHNLFNCFARVLYYCFDRNYTLICHVFVKRNIIILLNIFLSHNFFFSRVVLSLLTVIFATLLKCVVLCSGYDIQLSNSLFQLSIYYRMSRFMACISFISDFYISKTPFILLMVVVC